MGGYQEALCQVVFFVLLNRSCNRSRRFSLVSLCHCHWVNMKSARGAFNAPSVAPGTSWQTSAKDPRCRVLRLLPGRIECCSTRDEESERARDMKRSHLNAEKFRRANNPSIKAQILGPNESQGEGKRDDGFIFDRQSLCPVPARQLPTPRPPLISD